MTNFDLTQNFDFIFTYKIYLNWFQRIQNQRGIRLMLQQSPENFLTLLTFGGPSYYSVSESFTQELSLTESFNIYWLFNYRLLLH